MSTRTRIGPETVISAGDMTTTLTSKVTVLQSATIISYAYSWSGSSPVGTIAVECANDYSLYPTGLVNNAGTWNPMPLNVSGTVSTSVAVSGNTGMGFVDIDITGPYAIRTVYTAGSGTGSLMVVVNGKVS